MRAFRLIFVCGLPLLLCLLLLTGQSPAEDPNRFLRVQEWVGTFTAEFKNSLTIEGSHGVFRGTTEWSLNGSVKLKRKVTIKGGVENMWIGDGTATLTVNQEGTDMSSVGYQTSTKGSGQSTLTERGDGPTPIFQPFLLVNPFGKTYSLNFGYAGIQADDVFTRTDVARSERGPVMMRLGIQVGDMPLPDRGIRLTRTWEMPIGFTDGGFFVLDDHSRGAFLWGRDENWPKAKITWDLVPATEELEVVVELHDYENWLPSGGQDELTPGRDDLTVHARLQTKDGKPASQAAKRFKFELVDVSHEPGVSLNHPPRGRATADFKDLQFDPKRNGKLTVRPSPPVSQGSPEQTAETADGKYTEADAVISAYDWGAWGTLKVIADMPDGSAIIGHLKGDPSRTDILLPKRQANSKIADVWKEFYQVTSLSDDDDSENDPVGDGYRGDGLSLYEEYRGFHENVEHIRGDPTRKDFFVLNEVGTSAQSGITIFKTVTELLVHSNLRKDELGDDRCINCNHGHAHVVDQHGVRLRNRDPGFVGGKAVGGPGTPKQIREIILHMGRPGPLTSLSSKREYYKVVAHELLHSVNVWHHGEDDIRAVEWTTGTDIHGQAVVMETTLDEEGQLSGPSRPVEIYEDEREIPSDAFRDGRRIWVAVRGGQHSGSEECLMRYDVAGAYVIDSKIAGINRRRFIPSKEYQPAGIGLCSVKSGTVRFGDATKGQCEQQIRVNDK